MVTDIERKLVLLTLLASNRYPLTRVEIFKKLPSFYAGAGRKANSAKKMFERDKTELADSGFDLLAEPADSGEVKYRLNKPSDFLDRNFLLTPEQAKTLSECLEDPVFTGQLPGVALATLSKLLTFHAAFLAGPKASAIKIDKENHTLHFALQATREEKAIEVEYPSKEEKMERRVFSPYGTFMQSGACYLTAWCHREDMPKVLALYKIGRIAFSSEAYHPKPDGFSIARDYAFTNKWIKDETLGQRFVLKFDRTKAGQILEQHKFSILDHQKDGSVLAEFWTANPKMFFRFILRFGRHVEIIEPTAYRKAFLDYLRTKT